jgi:GNAT superfamily N-acetyltransferase
VPVRELCAADAPACDEVVRTLPYFFGVQEGLARCAEAVRSMRGWVATDAAGDVHGFLVIDYPLPEAPEITWMAVRAGRRRGGLGRALIDRAVRDLAGEGAAVLSVLTLAASVAETGPDTYVGTRAFYRAMGFHGVREIHPPGWDDPALLMVRHLAGYHRQDHTP